MVGRKIDYNSVPSADLENNSNQKKYTVNRGSSGDISISKPVCALFVMGALVLAAVAAVVTYFLAPSCSGHSLPESLTRGTQSRIEDEPSIKYVTLPRSVQPLHYRLYIFPKLETDFATSGNVTIKLKINEKTDEILLNALDLKINEHSVRVRRSQDGKDIKVMAQKYIEDIQGYSIRLEQSLNIKDEYELFMEFAGMLNDYMVGFYRSGYVTKDNVTRWIASTQFSPTDARRAFPCFDEPSFKAKFTISIARPSNMSSLSNMPLKDSSVIKSDNITWDNYNETPLMSSYLVAFIVHDFAPYQHSTNNSFTVWTRPNLIEQAVYAGDVGPWMLSFFEHYFNIKYSLPKIDVIALPDFGFNAMENWGLITFRESGLLLDRYSSTISNNRAVTLTLAHELAHFWFGNLVTPKGWDDLWLKEGFATYLEYLAASKTHPDWNITDEFFFDQTYKAMRIDRLISSRPIHFKVENSNDIRQVFDVISYSKGASLVNQMANILGENTFREALRKYLNTHAFSNADHDDLWNALTEQAQADGILEKTVSMKDVMDGWIHQAGFPVVTVTPDYHNNTLRFSQKRFILNGKTQTKSTEKWWIPISYTTTTTTKSNFEDGKPKFWLKNEDEVHAFNATLTQWYLVNLKQNYYIVNYDENNWKILSEIIMELPLVTRAQLVSDSMSLARAGLVDYSIPLNMLRNIGTRDQGIIFVPLEVIFTETDFLYNILYNTPAFGVYEKYFWYIFYFALDKVDFLENPDDIYIVKRIRRLVLPQACRQPNLKCALTARQIFRTWMEHAHPVPPNIRNVVYCTAIRDGGEIEWEFAYKEYLKATSASEKQTILTALGCSSKHWMLSRYLEMMISNTSGIRKQDGSILFDAVASNVYGHNLAFDFIRNRWEEINEYYGEGFRAVSRMVESLSTFMNTPEHLKQLETFRDENKVNLKATNQAFTNTIERVKTNVQWMKVNYKSVESWLKQQVEYYRL